MGGGPTAGIATTPDRGAPTVLAGPDCDEDTPAAALVAADMDGTTASPPIVLVVLIPRFPKVASSVPLRHIPFSMKRKFSLVFVTVGCVRVSL